MRFRVALFLTLFVITAGVSVVFVNQLSKKKKSDDSALKLSTLLARQAKVNFVLLSIGGADQPLLTGCIFGNYEPFSGRLALLYIDPSITFLAARSQTEATLLELYEAGGATRLRAALSSFFHEPIHFEISGGIYAIGRLVDLIGGVDLTLPETIRYNRPEDNLYIQLPAGRHRLFGDKVKEFLTQTSVAVTGDLTKRYNTFAISLIAQMGRHPDLADDKFFTLIKQYFSSDLSPQAFRVVWETLRKIRSYNVRVNELPVTTITDQGRAKKFPLKDKARALLPNVIQADTTVTAPQRITIQLLNGCGQKGLADQVRRFMLGREVIDVVEVGNASHFGYQTTEIVDRIGNPALAARVRNALGFGLVRSAKKSGLLVDVTIILGRDAREKLRNKDYGR